MDLFKFSFAMNDSNHNKPGELTEKADNLKIGKTYTNALKYH